MFFFIFCKPLTTFSNGYLGSRNDEERSEMRYVMRIAEFSESSNLWTHIALPGIPGSMPVWVSVYPSHPMVLCHGGGVWVSCFPLLQKREEAGHLKWTFTLSIPFLDDFPFLWWCDQTAAWWWNISLMRIFSKQLCVFVAHSKSSLWDERWTERGVDVSNHL